MRPVLGFLVPLALPLTLPLVLGACSGKSGTAAAPSGGSGGFQTLALVAGSLGGTGSLNGTGSSAGFNGVLGLASDGAGNLYAADTANDTIRKVVVATGTVTTIAGSPTLAGSTDGTGADARFNKPQGVGFAGGDLYVADTGNSVIRKIVLATGAVTTIAGTALAAAHTDGTGAAARFSYPEGIAGDGAGNLFVADTYNDVVRQIVLATGVVTTLPGAFEGLPDTVVSDGANNLYVAGHGGTTISKIDLTNGTTTSLSSGEASTSGGSNGLAIGGGTLYFADGQSAIFAVSLATSAATLLTGVPSGTGEDAGAPVFSAAVGLALDGAGNLYVSDDASVIRKVDLATGAVTALAGSVSVGGSADGVGSAASFDQVAGLAFDGASTLYVADHGNAAIRKIALGSGAVSTCVATAATNPEGFTQGLASPAGIALDGKGDLYIADDGTMTIRELTLSNGSLTTLAGVDGEGYEDSDGTGYDPNEPWQQSSATFASPAGIALETNGQGSLDVTDLDGESLRRVLLADGTTTTVVRTLATDGFGSDDAGAPPGLRTPQGVVSDGAGNVYVADSTGNVIWSVSLGGDQIGVLAGSFGESGSSDGVGAAARFNGPIGLTSDGAGGLYVADTGNATIRYVVIATGKVTTIAGAPGLAGDVLGPIAHARLRAPTWLAYGPGPVLYVADGNAVVVLR